LEKSSKYLNITAALLLVLFLAPLAIPQDKTEQRPDEKARQQMLEREAANALRRLKRSMEKDGFYSGHVALNIWRSTAVDAGTFNEAQYDEFKTQLYEKSVNDSLRCFEEFLLEEDFIMPISVFRPGECIQRDLVHMTRLSMRCLKRNWRMPELQKLPGGLKMNDIWVERF
jgi:hypothetical protein